ncbi:MAG: DegT/DnrJ/EryC1/StrS family aminotransferase [Planctomycetota bacterium]
MSRSLLAIHGGPKAVTMDPGDMFKWPIVTKEDERAVLDVLRTGRMSGLDVTTEFEKEFAEWHGVAYALAHNTGTAALHAAMFGCGLGVGDEIIAPSLTYWASCLQAFSLGATIVFADVRPDTICIDPADIEHRITDRTKAVMVVHYCGMPCDMDPILAITRRHGLKLIEDVSHAHGGLYKGRLLGTLGDVAGFSLMSGKSLPCGEGGILITSNRDIYLRAVAFGHYERTREVLAGTRLERFAGLPMGGCKYRMHQLTSALGRGQLRHYRERMTKIQKALNCFWDLLEETPGLQAHRTPKGSGSTMAGWYNPLGLYVAEELDGLPIDAYLEAVRAEGVTTSRGANFPLHLHPLLNECDVYGHGKPTRIAHSARDVRQGPGSLPVSEALQERVFGVPYFKKHRPKVIAEYAEAFRKVALNATELRSSAAS